MKRTTKIIAMSIAAAIGLGATGFAMAKDGGMGHRGMGMGGKMGEAAITVCANQAEGANVKFDHPMWGQVNAVCAKLPDGKVAAMPAKMVAHMQESKAACEGKKEGDKVSVTDMMDPSKKIDATCKQRGDILAARPEHKGMMGMGGKDGHRGHGMKGDAPASAPM